MRILVVMPKLVEKAGEYYDMPLGVLYISAALKAAGFTVFTLNLNETDASLDDAIGTAVTEQQIDVLCTGGLSREFVFIRSILAAAKKASAELVTVCGGGLITSEPELMLDNLSMDIGVLGEGEITIVELIEALQQNKDLSQVNGIIYRDQQGQAVQTAERPVVTDLDSLPYPDYESFGIQAYLDSQRPTDSVYTYVEDDPRFLPIICSRGCPFNCTFCYHPLGHKYRRRSLDSFFAELDFYVRTFRVNILYIMDELFSMDEEFMLGFCERIKPYNLQWLAQTRPDIKITEPTLHALKEAGMYYLGYGLENASNDILKSMNRNISIDLVEERYAVTKRVGIRTGGNLLFGDPAETVETARCSLDWLLENRHRYLINAAAVISPFPGSQVWEHCLEKGLITDKIKYLEDGCRRVNMTEMTDDDFEGIFFEIDRIYATGRKFAEVVAVEQTGFDERRDNWLYSLDIVCPHCQQQVNYRNLLVKRLEVFPICCRSCGLVFNLLPETFKHFQETIQTYRKRLLELTQGDRPVSFSPFLFRENFREFLSLLGLDEAKLNILYLLDFRPRDYMNNSDASDYSVLPRSAENLTEHCDDHVIAVLPWPSTTYKQIVNHLRDDCGVTEDRLVYVPFTENLYLEGPILTQ